jgi:hypothetical protein
LWDCGPLGWENVGGVAVECGFTIRSAVLVDMV